MNHNNKTYKLSIILLIITVGLICSCKKEEKQETIVTVRCVTPHNNQGVAGCKVTVYEVKTLKDGAILGDLKTKWLLNHSVQLFHKK